MSELRATEIISESALAGYAQALSPLALNEPLIGGYSHVRASLGVNEPLIGGYSHVRAPLMMLESLFPVPPEEIMVTATLPGFGNSTIDPTRPAALDRPPLMRGLTFPIARKPQFNTRVSDSTSLNSTRLALADYPRWNFELTFSFLEDYSGATSALRLIEGAFCNAKGKALPFLFKDRDGYAETGAVLATGDGVTLQFDFMRWIATYSEPVGQVDVANAINVYGGVDEAATIPASGPYTVTVAQAAAFTSDQGVTISGTPLTKVAGAPGAMQYAVAAGVYTFNSAQHGASAVISYTYLVDPAAYVVTMPNKIVFGSAPANGTRLTADFQYFYTCFFDIDIADFSKFASQLWELKSLTFHSELLA
jgi:hypothetical protein